MNPTNKNFQSADILNQIKKKGTFKINPEDESFIQSAAGQGFSEAQIIKGIEAKRKLATTNPSDVNPDNLTVDQAINPSATDTNKATVDPFKGKTRTQFLKDAFMSGVTSVTELEKLGKTYDMLATPDTESTTIAKTPAEQEAVKQIIEKQATAKMGELKDATARDSALSALSALRTGGDIMSTLEQNKVETGLFKGIARQGVFGVGGRSLGLTTKEEDAFAALTEVFAANFRKALSGAQVSDKEMARLDKFLPSETKTKQANIEGVKELSQYLSDKASLQLGLDISPLIPKETGVDPLNILGGNGTITEKNYLGI
jgi:hypothetical protein